MSRGVSKFAIKARKPSDQGEICLISRRIKATQGKNNSASNLQALPLPPALSDFFAVNLFASTRSFVRNAVLAAQARDREMSSRRKHPSDRSSDQVSEVQKCLRIEPERMEKIFTILLCDDDRRDAEQMQMALKDCGVPIRLFLARSADAALGFFAEPLPFSEKNPFPDLVILDLKQPLLNGLEVLTWLRSHRDWDRLPVVVLGSSPLGRDAADAYHLGASSCFTRPHTPPELRELASLLVFYWSWERRSASSMRGLKENGCWWSGNLLNAPQRSEKATI
jgi:CheY-like chemotaxis protein